MHTLYIKTLQYVDNYLIKVPCFIYLCRKQSMIYNSDMHFLLFQGPAGHVGPAGAFGPRGLAVSLLSKYITTLLQEEKTSFIIKGSQLCSSPKSNA